MHSGRKDWLCPGKERRSVQLSWVMTWSITLKNGSLCYWVVVFLKRKLKLVCFPGEDLQQKIFAEMPFFPRICLKKRNSMALKTNKPWIKLGFLATSKLFAVDGNNLCLGMLNKGEWGILSCPHLISRKPVQMKFEGQNWLCTSEDVRQPNSVNQFDYNISSCCIELQLDTGSQ